MLGLVRGRSYKTLETMVTNMDYNISAKRSSIKQGSVVICFIFQTDHSGSCVEWAAGGQAGRKGSTEVMLWLSEEEVMMTSMRMIPES